MTTPIKPPSMLIAEVTDQLDYLLVKELKNSEENSWISNVLRDEILPKLELAKMRAVILEVRTSPPTDDKLPIDEITQAVYENLTTNHMADLKSDIRASIGTTWSISGIDLKDLAKEVCLYDLSQQIDLEKLCGEFESSDIARHIDTDVLARELDPSHIADYVDTSAIAEHIEVSSDEVAQHMNIGASDIAQHIDLEDLASEIDYESLIGQLHIGLQANGFYEKLKTDAQPTNDEQQTTVLATLDKILHVLNLIQAQVCPAKMK